MSACVGSLDVSITVSTVMVTSNYSSREAQVYSHRWPQPAGQWALLFSQFIICSRCPPWLQPWHHTNIPFTTWWHTAHMLAHWRHLEGGGGQSASQISLPQILTKTAGNTLKMTTEEFGQELVWIKEYSVTELLASVLGATAFTCHRSSPCCSLAACSCCSWCAVL